jgi:hypothetical protein
MDLVQKIEGYGMDSGKTKAPIKITESGTV